MSWRSGWSGSTRSCPSKGASTACRSASPGSGSRFAVVRARDRKSTRLNSSHANISYAVFCLKKKKIFYTWLNYCGYHETAYDIYQISNKQVANFRRSYISDAGQFSSGKEKSG